MTHHGPALSRLLIWAGIGIGSRKLRICVDRDRVLALRLPPLDSDVIHVHTGYQRSNVVAAMRRTKPDSGANPRYKAWYEFE